MNEKSSFFKQRFQKMMESKIQTEMKDLVKENEEQKF